MLASPHRRLATTLLASCRPAANCATARRAMATSSKNNDSSSSFTHPDSQVPIHLPPATSLTPTLSRNELLDFPAFKTWHSTLTHSLSLQESDSSHPFHKSPYQLRSITVTGVDRFGGGKRLGFVKVSADVRNSEDEALPGIALLRGPSVALLVIMTVHGEGEGMLNKGVPDDEYALLTVQPRVPAGSMAFVELPAGMLDDHGSFAGAAAKELEEETGIVADEKELVDMTALLAKRDQSGHHHGKGEQLQPGVYTSAGGLDESVPLLLLRRRVTRQQMNDFEGKLTGERGSGERITLKVVRLGDVWREAWRDSKALSAVAVYQGLKREGKL